MSDLKIFKQKLAASREQWVEVAHIKVLLRRQPQLRIAEIRDAALGENSYIAALLQACVQGWKGVKASDLLPDGDDAEVAYEPELLDALLENQTIGPLFVPVFLDFWKRKTQAEESAEKN